MIRLNSKYRKYENNENTLKKFVCDWNFHLNHPRMEIMSPTTAVGDGHNIIVIAELHDNSIHIRTFKKIKDEFFNPITDNIEYL